MSLADGLDRTKHLFAWILALPIRNGQSGTCIPHVYSSSFFLLYMTHLYAKNLRICPFIFFFPLHITSRHITPREYRLHPISIIRKRLTEQESFFRPLDYSS